MALSFVWTADNDAKVLLWIQTLGCVSVYKKKEAWPYKLVFR